MEKNLFVFLIALLLPLASLSVAGDTFRIEFLGGSDAALDNPHDIKLGSDGKRILSRMSTMTGLSYWTRIAWRYSTTSARTIRVTPTTSISTRTGVFMLPIRITAG